MTMSVGVEMFGGITKWTPRDMVLRSVNPLRPNNDLSQTSHCNIKGLSIGEAMRIENKITPVKSY